jgi:hypothetical protein
MGCEDVDWIRLAQYRDHWRGLANTIMQNCVSPKAIFDQLSYYYLFEKKSAPGNRFKHFGASTTFVCVLCL